MKPILLVFCTLAVLSCHNGAMRKTTPGFPWTSAQEQFLQSEAAKGHSVNLAHENLNNKFHKNSTKKRTRAAVQNKVDILKIKFSYQRRGTKSNWTATKLLETEVRKHLLAGMTKEQIIELYRADPNIPIVKFRQWIITIKGRTSRVPIDKKRPMMEKEEIFQQWLHGVKPAELAQKYLMTPYAAHALIQNHKVRRQNLMIKILTKVPAYDIMAEFDLDHKGLTYFRELAPKLEIEAIDAELPDAPIWTPEEEENAFAAIIASADSMRALDKEKRAVTIPLSTDLEYICLLCSGDWHVESMYTDQRALMRDLDIVRETPGVFMGFCGDAMDNAIPAGPHRDLLNDRASSIKLARAAIRGLFRKSASKLLWINTGCHVKWTIAATDYNPYEEFAKQLHIPYLGPGGTITLKLNGLEYRGHARHKYAGGGNNLTAPCKNYLMKQDADCDFVIVAHNHVNAVGMEEWQGKPRVLIRAGSYKDVDTFANNIGYRSQTQFRNPPCIIFKTRGEKRMIGIQSLDDAVKIMNGLNSGKV